MLREDSGRDRHTVPLDPTPRTIASRSAIPVRESRAPSYCSCASGLSAIAELIDEICALLFRDPAAEILVILGVPLADVGSGQDDVRTHRAQVEDLFLAHLVGQNQNQAVALLCGATSARPSPVLPAVASTMVSPGFEVAALPRPASIIEIPMRSLTEPPGFISSSFRNRPAFTGVEFATGLEHRSLARPSLICWNRLSCHEELREKLAASVRDRAARGYCRKRYYNHERLPTNRRNAQGRDPATSRRQ